MPHFGLIDESLPEDEKLLLRARLHIRGGKIRLKRGEISAGISALYDALIHSLYWFYFANEQLKPLLYNDKGFFKDENSLYFYLIENGHITDRFDFKSFVKLSNRALVNELNKSNNQKLLEDYDILMKELHILPFTEKDLPAGVPITL